MNPGQLRILCWAIVTTLVSGAIAIAQVANPLGPTPIPNGALPSPGSSSPKPSHNG
jgi:hypothetical protein